MKNLKLFFKGIAMGFSDIIPGISGATIALITGIYAKLIENIKKVLTVKNFEDIKKLDYFFFIFLGLGLFSAIFLGANLVGYLIDYFPSKTYSFFFGLILASAILIFKDLKQKNYQLSILGIFAGLIIGGLNFNISANNYFVTMLLGMVVVFAMIIPGISGSYLLLILGKYEFMINVLRNLDLLNILFFILGGFLTLVLTIKTIKKLLDKKANQTISFFTGLMIGALSAIVSNISNFLNDILFLLLGALIAYTLRKLK